MNPFICLQIQTVHVIQRTLDSQVTIPGFLLPTKTYSEGTQWHGKEMCNLSGIVLGAFPIALRTPTAAKRIVSEAALKWLHSFLDINLVAQYKIQRAETREQIDQYLPDFHQYRDDFLEFGAYKTTTKAINNQTQVLNASKRQRTAESFICHLRSLREIEEIRVASQSNFLKMHLLTHFRQHVE